MKHSQRAFAPLALLLALIVLAGSLSLPVLAQSGDNPPPEPQGILSDLVAQPLAFADSP